MLEGVDGTIKMVFDLETITDLVKAGECAKHPSFRLNRKSN